MASKGIFSYNSDMIRGQNSGYYLVAKPLDELKLTDLPPSIGPYWNEQEQISTLLRTNEYVN